MQDMVVGIGWQDLDFAQGSAVVVAVALKRFSPR
jgi:hypothetical protein